MAKKRSTNRDYVAFSYAINSLDTNRSKAEVLGTMIDAAESGSGVLPPGWDITWRWQNKQGGPWNEDSFQDTVANSRGGFLVLMARRLRRHYLQTTGHEFVGIQPREATSSEEMEIEEQSEELEEERRGRENIKRKRGKRGRGKKRAGKKAKSRGRKTAKHSKKRTVRTRRHRSGR